MKPSDISCVAEASAERRIRAAACPSVSPSPKPSETSTGCDSSTLTLELSSTVPWEGTAAGASSPLLPSLLVSSSITSTDGEADGTGPPLSSTGGEGSGSFSATTDVARAGRITTTHNRRNSFFIGTLPFHCSLVPPGHSSRIIFQKIRKRGKKRILFSLLHPSSPQKTKEYQAPYGHPNAVQPKPGFRFLPTKKTVHIPTKRE